METPSRSMRAPDRTFHNSPPQVGRRGRAAAAILAPLVALVTLGGVLVAAPVAAQDDAPGTVVRIVARKIADGRVEFGLQQRQADRSWGERQLPRARFFPTTADVGRWLASSPLSPSGAEVRIVARKIADGRVEFGLQQRQADRSWGERQLPRARFFPTTAGVGRWLASSPVTLGSAGSRYTAISASGQHSCALRGDGTITCWGDNGYGQTNAPAGRYTAIEAGARHTCALRSNGTITCWGDNFFGQASAPGGEHTAISAGSFHSCALRRDGTIACWGAEGQAQANAPAGKYTAIAVGTWYSCALRSDGTIACWSLPDHGVELDAPDGQYTAIAVGGDNDHVCGIRLDRTIACAGNNNYGQADAPAGEYTAIAVSDGISCALRGDGTIACWSSSYLGETDPPAGRYTAIAVSGVHACALRGDGTIACWGNNYSGQTDAPAG